MRTILPFTVALFAFGCTESGLTPIPEPEGIADAPEESPNGDQDAPQVEDDPAEEEPPVEEEPPAEEEPAEEEPAEEEPAEEEPVEEEPVEEPVLEDTGVLEDTAEPVTIAEPDFDIASDPLYEHNFRPYPQDRVFTATNDVSDPTGDREDWIAFNTLASQNTTTRVTFTLDCAGDAEAQIIDEDDFSNVGVPLTCGNTRDHQLLVNHDYLLRISAGSFDGSDVYVPYTITIEN